MCVSDSVNLTFWLKVKIRRFRLTGEGFAGWLGCYWYGVLNYYYNKIGIGLGIRKGVWGWGCSTLHFYYATVAGEGYFPAIHTLNKKNCTIFF